jgi:hypothetical protein
MGWQGGLVNSLGSNEEPVSWVLDGYLARGSLTLLVARWKGGKTTWETLLLAAVCQGIPYLGQTLQCRKVYVWSEENEGLWRDRLQDYHLDPHRILVKSRPFMRKPTWQGLESTLAALAPALKNVEVDLFVIDTFSCFFPGLDENSAPDAQRFCNALQPVLQAGVAVLLLHHPAKGDRPEGHAGRGSGALLAAADILIEMGQTQGHPNRRVLKTMARSGLDSAPRELIIQLSEDKRAYTVVGDSSEAAPNRRMAIYETLLRLQPHSTKEILAAWPEAQSKPSDGTVVRDLGRLLNEGRVQRSGEGCKNDAHRYVWAVNEDLVADAHGTEEEEAGLDPFAHSTEEEEPDLEAL